MYIHYLLSHVHYDLSHCKQTPFLLFQIHPRANIHQASARAWQGFRLQRLLPLHEKRDSNEAGQHDHGAEAPTRGAKKAKGVRANPQRLHHELQVSIKNDLQQKIA